MGIFGKKKEEQGQDTHEQKDVVATSSEKKVKKTKKTEETYDSFAGAYNVIVGPVITEKAHALSEKGQYVFRVHADAQKRQVKSVVEKMYGVVVMDVRMILVKPKRRTVKYDRGYQKKYKKAVVTLKKGQSIAVFQGV